ncbi:MAG: hypothetical protein HRT74_05535, partial [Flavobacteriales bacterium]|nr:hypothetical protein [Flavobacteriales bacterium]
MKKFLLVFGFCFFAIAMGYSQEYPKLEQAYGDQYQAFVDSHNDDELAELEAFATVGWTITESKNNADYPSISVTPEQLEDFNPLEFNLNATENHQYFRIEGTNQVLIVFSQS